MSILAGLISIGTAQADRLFPSKNNIRAFKIQASGLPATQHLNYYGGAVLSNVKVIAVFWGKNVDQEVVRDIGGFYSHVVNSTYIDWLDEYNTKILSTTGKPGTNQNIGRGSFVGGITITPANSGTRLDKKDIEAEIEWQINNGGLTVPTANTLYMIHFPAGITLLTGGQASCTAWCGDHEGFHSAKHGDVAYAMLPDIGPSCGSGCTFAGNDFDSMTVIVSHELIESITDPMCPDIGVNPAFPAAWLAADQNEIGDICAGPGVPLASLTSASRKYAIQAEFDNTTNSCKGGNFNSP